MNSFSRKEMGRSIEPLSRHATLIYASHSIEGLLMSDNPSTNENAGWAKIGLLAALSVYLIYDMATAVETPSMALRTLQYVILAACLFSFAGLLWKRMSAER
jgi:hypothetical protein